MSELKIDTLLKTIEEWESKLAQEKNSQTVNHLIALYNKAVEYYSALNDDKHLQYLMKVKQLFNDEALLKSIEYSDLGTDSASSLNKSGSEN